MPKKSAQDTAWTCGDTVKEITDKFQAETRPATSCLEDPYASKSSRCSDFTTYERQHRQYLQELTAHYQFHVERKMGKKSMPDTPGLVSKSCFHVKISVLAFRWLMS
jgi:hypothetical protein